MTSKCFLLALLAAVPLLPGAMPGAAAASDPPALPREFRAVWIASVANIDWPSRPGLSTAQQQAELIRILDMCKDLNMNGVILQIRPACDALYDSKLEPWSEYLTGQQGKAPDPYYDPLEFATTEAHKRGLEMHVWFNPYRALHPSAKSPVHPSHISKTRPALVKSYGKHLWLDPGEPEVQDHSLNVIMDVVKRYDIDGVHIDDYFYPYRERDADGKLIDFPDGPSWKKYVDGGGTLKRDDWRRENVNVFVQRIYQSIKAEKPWVKFGISPFGIARPGRPAGVTGMDQYVELYADAEKWLVNGWMDYWTPQLYWRVSSTGQPYEKLLQFWVQQNKFNRHIWPGNFTSKVADGSQTSWPASEVLEQISITRRTPGATGNVHFSMKAFLQNRDGLNDKLKSGPYANPALVPASPWLKATPPPAPTLVKSERTGDGSVNTQWKAPDEPIRWWVVYTRRGSNWESSVEAARAGQEFSVERRNQAGIPVDAIAVSVIDLVGNESQRHILEWDLKDAQ